MPMPVDRPFELDHLHAPIPQQHPHWLHNQMMNLNRADFASSHTHSPLDPYQFSKQQLQLLDHGLQQQQQQQHAYVYQHASSALSSSQSSQTRTPFTTSSTEYEYVCGSSTGLEGYYAGPHGQQKMMMQKLGRA